MEINQVRPGRSLTHVSAHPAYRRDIDGLRAVAVIAVVVFHGFPNLLEGGFVGVDVFFVISGYLISGIILNGLAHGSFRFADFYQRRIRRIFPSLTIVLLTFLVLGWILLLPDEYRQLAKHSAAGAGFASNIVLWKEVGYFDTVGARKPLFGLVP
jgi:peptidoglycan/LPS O-acetylase OafA/YrhL